MDRTIVSAMIHLDPEDDAAEIIRARVITEIGRPYIALNLGTRSTLFVKSVDHATALIDTMVTARAALADAIPPKADGVAVDRAETDSCERGTPGCCIHHTTDSECATW